MRVLMITQKIDPTDPLLAFVPMWVTALAARVEHLDVLCLEQPTIALPTNVTAWSMGKERGRNRLRQAWRHGGDGDEGKAGAAQLELPRQVVHGRFPLYLFFLTAPGFDT